MDSDLSRVYYDVENPAGFASIDKLYTAFEGKYKRTEIKKWLEAQDAFTLHKQRRKLFPRNRFFVTNIDEIWQADINDMRNLKKHNDGYNYILSVIDTFSKFAWAIPLYTKTGKEVTDAFKRIFSESSRKPLKLNCDKGKEFVNKTFQDFLKSRKIYFYTTNNPDTKASIIERWNRTLKTKMWRYFTFKNSYRYINALNMMVESYNNTVHSSTKYAPSAINDTNILQVFRNLYACESFTSYSKPKFSVGDKVRISRQKDIFEKGYVTNYSEEIFVIDKVFMRNPIVYEIKDLSGEIITGTFYEYELQKVAVSDETPFKIDKIFDSKGRGVSRQYLVRWKGYPPKFDSWVSAKDIEST